MRADQTARAGSGSGRADRRRIGAFRLNSLRDRWQCDDDAFAIHGLVVTGHLATTELLAALHPEDRLRTYTALRRGTHFGTSYRVPLPDGGLRYVSLSGRWRADEHGGEMYAEGCFVDITSDVRLFSEAAVQGTPASAAPGPHRP